MTRRETFSPATIGDKDFVLATDLDGTFLGGTDDARAAFYGWIEENRDSVGLIFVTGRDPAFIKELVEVHGVPRPEYVIGDVGTTIAKMDADLSITPIEALEHDISAAWNDAGPRVREALNLFDGITLQLTEFRYRLSYDMEPARFDNRIFEIVDGLGLDAIQSDNRYFDVLPRGVSKGPSLLKLISHLNIDADRVLVAGDTLNDLSMLELSLPGVAVGGSEQALLDKIAALDHVHRPSGIGVDGIREAISHYGLHPRRKETA